MPELLYLYNSYYAPTDVNTFLSSIQALENAASPFLLLNKQHVLSQKPSLCGHISGKRWGDARHYELTVDSSVGLEKAAEKIVQHISVYPGMRFPVS